MKSVTLRHMQHHLSEVMRHVDQGNEVLVTRRSRAIAKLVPVQTASQATWPDFATRAEAIKGGALSTSILEERD